MFGWSKKEKNMKAIKRVSSEIENISVKGKKRIIRDLRDKYPEYSCPNDFDFIGDIISNDLLYLYLLLKDNTIVGESIDNVDTIDSTSINESEDSGRYSPLDIDYENNDIEKPVIVDNFFSIDRSRYDFPVGDGGCCGGCSCDDTGGCCGDDTISSSD